MPHSFLRPDPPLLQDHRPPSSCQPLSLRSQLGSSLLLHIAPITDSHPFVTRAFPSYARGASHQSPSPFFLLHIRLVIFRDIGKNKERQDEKTGRFPFLVLFFRFPFILIESHHEILLRFYEIAHTSVSNLRSYKPSL